MFAEPNMHIVRYYNAWTEVMIYYIKTIVSHLDVSRRTPKKKSRQWKTTRNRHRASPFVHMCLLNPDTHIVHYHTAWIDVMIY